MDGKEKPMSFGTAYTDLYDSIIWPSCFLFERFGFKCHKHHGFDPYPANVENMVSS